MGRGVETHCRSEAVLLLKLQLPYQPRLPSLATGPSLESAYRAIRGVLYTFQHALERNRSRAAICAYRGFRQPTARLPWLGLFCARGGVGAFGCRFYHQETNLRSVACREASALPSRGTCENSEGREKVLVTQLTSLQTRPT